MSMGERPKSSSGGPRVWGWKRLSRRGKWKDRQGPEQEGHRAPDKGLWTPRCSAPEDSGS